ncbi:MAG: tRNA(Ile)(2)-agmatinylcytidine synthase [Thaumarchaeota archaeon]|nr:tRNA(Ile)(2)-agmatinylcytidine synthase [Nitrososphaerota archaeon]
MRCLVGIDDTDSSRGYCTTYLAYRITTDLVPLVKVLPYPRLVRLNPNVPFKTRGNAAICLPLETSDPERAFRLLASKVAELSDVEGGANTGMVFLEDLSLKELFRPVYLDALSGIVNPNRVRRVLSDHRVKSFELGNGMGLVGAASALAFDESYDHTYELIAYRRKEFWGTKRLIDSASVKEMEIRTWPHTLNNYDHQKRKVLIAPHGPDPVLLGIRGDSPAAVLEAFRLVSFEERQLGHMIYLSNQHTDAHVEKPLDWKVYSSGWAEGKVSSPKVGPGGHVYFELDLAGKKHNCAVYEPTGDLRRVAKLLRDGDAVRVYGGVRRPTSKHLKVINVEKIQVLSVSKGPPRTLARGVYISSPRANRHLTKPFARYGYQTQEQESTEVSGWLGRPSIETPALA